MNSEDEKIAVATCKICLLAQYMRVCALCKFNIGLGEKETEE